MEAPGILLVSPYDLAVPGGVQGQVRGMALELQRRGRRVLVASPGAGRDVELDGAGVDSRGFGFVARVAANGSVAPLTLSPLAARALQRWAVDAGPLVAHLHEPATPVLGWALLRRHRGGLVGTFHRSGIDRLYSTAAPLLRHLLGRLDGAAAVSVAAATTAQATLGVDPTVLFNGLDLEAAASAPPWPARGPTILFLGRDEPRKGRQVLLEAARALEPSTTIWLTGEPPSAISPGGATLEWLGVISEDEKRRRLQAADVLCAPSLGGESFGMVLLEGLAAGCTVVASDIDGYRQALGGHGIVVAPDDVASLVDGLRRGFEPRSQAEVAGALGHARRWSMGALVDRYEDLYEAAASAQHLARRR